MENAMNVPDGESVKSNDDLMEEQLGIYNPAAEEEQENITKINFGRRKSKEKEEDDFDDEEDDFDDDNLDEEEDEDEFEEEEDFIDKEPPEDEDFYEEDFDFEEEEDDDTDEEDDIPFN